MTSPDYLIIKAEERNVDLASRVSQTYFMFRDHQEPFSEDFLEGFAPHFGLDLDVVRMVYNSGRREVRSLLIAQPGYAIIPTLDEMH